VAEKKARAEFKRMFDRFECNVFEVEVTIAPNPEVINERKRGRRITRVDRAMRDMINDD